MTRNEKQAAWTRKVLRIKAHLREVRDKYGLPRIGNARMNLLADALAYVEGDAPTEHDLRAVYRLTARGMKL